MIKFDLNASQEGVDAIDQSGDQASNSVTKANTEFLGGRTICAHFDGNAELASDQLTSSSPWSDKKVNAAELEAQGLTALKDC